MADEKRDQHAGNDNTDPSTEQDGDGMSGQPIGGNDSNTGTGTTLTQGADFGSKGDPHKSGDSDHGDIGRHSDQSQTGGEGFVIQPGSATDDLQQSKHESSAIEADKESQGESPPDGA